LAAYKSLIVSLELRRLDYGNATLSSLPDYLFRRLQSIINAADLQSPVVELCNVSLDRTALVECNRLS